MARVYYQGIPVDIEITGSSEVINPDGSKSILVHVHANIPPGPGGPGEPVELPRAA